MYKALNRTIYDYLDGLRAAIEYQGVSMSLWHLERYLAGYCRAMEVNQIYEPTVPPFDFFAIWLVQTYKRTSFVQGWPGALLAKAKNDEGKALELFFQLVERYKKLRPTPGPSVDVPKEDAGENEPAGAQFGRGRHRPERIQVVQLGPGDLCYLRYWCRDQVEAHGLFPDFDSAFRIVQSNYNISPHHWTNHGVWSEGTTEIKDSK